MKKKQLMTLVVCVILAYLLIPILINILASIPNPWVKGNPNTVEATWIGFFGDYAGGLFSTLVGGFIAYILIFKESKENIEKHVTSSIALDMFRDYQTIKNSMIGDTTDIHTIMQNFHAGFTTSFDEFKEEYNEKMLAFRKTQTMLRDFINKNVFILAVVKDKNNLFDINAMTHSFTCCILEFNFLRMNFSQQPEYDIIKYYNEVCIPKMNDFRNEMTLFEKIIIVEFFPSLYTSRNVQLASFVPIIYTEYDDIITKYSESYSENRGESE